MSNITEIDPGDNPVTKAAREYVKAGMVLVPLKGGDKMPTADEWSLRKNCLDATSAIGQLYGVGIAHLYSRTCTIDIDDLPKAVAFFKRYNLDLNKYINAADAVRILSGRENRSKLLYRIPDNTEAPRIVVPHGSGLELRCATKKATTVQDVLPPSIHPKTGKPYTWAGDWRRIPMIPLEILQLWINLLTQHKTRTWNVKDVDVMELFVDSALNVLDPDMDYNVWIEIGQALDNVGLGEKWEAWSERGDKYQPGDCEGRLAGFDPEGGRSIGSFWHRAIEAGWDKSKSLDDAIGNVLTDMPGLGDMPRIVALIFKISKANQVQQADVFKKLKSAYALSVAAIRDSVYSAMAEVVSDGDSLELTHGELSQKLLDLLVKRHPPELVCCEGKLWYADKFVWRKYDTSSLKKIVADEFKEQKLCKRGSEYYQVAQHTIERCELREDFFSSAPRGLLTPNGFHTLDGKTETASNDQRQRFSIDFDPVHGPMPMFEKLLSAVVADCIDSLQEFMGAVLVGAATSYSRALLMVGESGAGKSQFVHLLQLIVGEEFSRSIAPHDLKKGEFITSLVNARLNARSELSDDKVVSSETFKEIISGDTITARPLYDNPYSLTPEAGHIFSANRVPATDEDDEAFWRRWIMVKWVISDDRKERERRDPGLDIQEFGRKIFDTEKTAIVAWALEGAKRLHSNNKYSLGITHHAMIKEWKQERNSVYAWLEARTIRKEGLRMFLADALHDYGSWCLLTKRRAVSRSEFREHVCSFLSVASTSRTDNKERWDDVGISFDQKDL